MTEAIASDETHTGARHFCKVVRSAGLATTPRIFVAGCGAGHEALFIRTELDMPLVGADVGKDWDPELGAEIGDFTLLAGDVHDLPLADESFEIVFYHHVIEHVSDPAGSLRELARILRPGGLIYVGTPNRHRVVGYLGSFDATTMDKVRWNLSDYRARLTGRFRNELGAHAGFSEAELRRLLEQQFVDIRFLTGDYLRFKYGRRLGEPVLRALTAHALREWAAPSVYAIARKPGELS